jgi:hypothetical protein
MGLRHVVTLTFSDDTTDEQVEEIVGALRRLPSQIDELRSYVVGTDAGLAQGNSHLAIVADFDDVASYEVYRDHPAHQAVITELILPVVAGRSAVQHHT